MSERERGRGGLGGWRRGNEWKGLRGIGKSANSVPPVADRCLPIYVFRHRLFRNDDRVPVAGTTASS